MTARKQKVVFDPEECPECGSERLKMGALYANGREWSCKSCKHEFMADEPDDTAPTAGAEQK